MVLLTVTTEPSSAPLSGVCYALLLRGVPFASNPQRSLEVPRRSSFSRVSALIFYLLPPTPPPPHPFPSGAATRNTLCISD
jgi:hypothetical protein